MSMTNYLEDAVLNHILRNTSMTSPTTIYVGLFTAAPSDAGGGTELSGDGYSRQSVAFDDPAGGGTTQNSAQVSFTASGGNWGSVTHFALFDASSSGNMLFWAALDTSRTVNDGDTLDFDAGELTVTLD